MITRSEPYHNRNVLAGLIKGDKGDTGESAIPVSHDTEPNVVPAYEGQIWVDTIARRAWVAVGKASVSDWLEINTPGTAKLYNSTTLTIQPIELQGAEAEAAIVIGPS